MPLIKQKISSNLQIKIFSANSKKIKKPRACVAVVIYKDDARLGHPPSLVTVFPCAGWGGWLDSFLGNFRLKTPRY